MSYSEVMKEKTVEIKREGLPMNEEQIKDWQKAFSDVIDSINALYKGDKKTKVRTS